MTFVKKKLQYEDVDYIGNYKLSSLFATLTSLATENASEIGLWSEEMKEDYGWVVAKQTMVLDEPIMINDIIEISTQIDKGTFVTFPRNYYIRKDNRLVGKIAAIWTLIDLKKRSIVAPKRLGLTVPDLKCDMPLDTPKNIHEDVDFELVSHRQVLYSDLDVNQHMNNTRYLEWACDLLDVDIYKEKYIKEVSVNYKKEIKPLALVDLYLGKDNDRFVVKGTVEGETSFIIELFFENR